MGLLHISSPTTTIILKTALDNIHGKGATNMYLLALKQVIWCVKWPKYLYLILKTRERAAKQRLKPLTTKQLVKQAEKGRPSTWDINNHY